MFKHFKAVTAISVMTLAFMASAPASAQSGFPSAASEGSGGPAAMFWTEAMMKAMDANKDGMVSRKEFMDYMGAQFDKMDAKKDGMLTKGEFMDKKMMATTFVFPSAGKE